MNFMEQGIDWFNKRMHKHLVEPVKITTALNSKAVVASIIEPESSVNSEGLRVKSDHYVFLINAASISSLKIARGITIERQLTGETYEVVTSKRDLDDFNDPNNDIKAIPAKLRCY